MASYHSITINVNYRVIVMPKVEINIKFLTNSSVRHGSFISYE
jgi:hypothetical protein